MMTSNNFFTSIKVPTIIYKHQDLLWSEIAVSFNFWEHQTIGYKTQLAGKASLPEYAYIYLVCKIPYRRAPRLAFRPSASREQRYLAYKYIYQGGGKHDRLFLYRTSIRLISVNWNTVPSNNV